MFEGIFFGVFTAFVLLGVVSVCYYIMLKILHPKTSGRYIVVIPAGGEKRDVASLMYAEKLRIGLLGDRGVVVALDCGMQEYERTVCENMCGDSDGLYICTPEKLGELLSREDL